MVKDIWPGSHGSGAFSNMIAFKNILYFGTYDGTYGRELWMSNGTANGTQMVKDINPGSAGSFPYNLAANGNTLFFRAQEGTYGIELWISNGTASGTHMVKDIRSGASGSWAEDLTFIGDTLFFQANNGINGKELWMSDGTSGGTKLIKDIYPGSNWATPEQFKVVGDTLFFRADDGINGIELWKSDGTAIGTQMVKDIYPGSNGSTPEQLTVVDNALFFVADDGIYGKELWMSDGTASGTQIVKDIYSGSNGSTPEQLTVVGDTLFFVADDGIHSGALWKCVQNFYPKANFTYIPHSPSIMDTIQFIDNSTDCDGVIVNWTWDFDDGNISSEQNPVHKYHTDGLYHVTLTVTDDDNAMDTTHKNISVISPPIITNVTITTSDPLDTSIGWENVSCTVTDNTYVDEVKLILTGNTTTEYSMIKNGDVYYLNITIETADDYTYRIWADDTIGNYNTSSHQPFDLPMNEDVDMGGKVHFMDLVAVSLMYNAVGPSGWVREDVDNSGSVHFMDLVAISMAYNEEW